MAASQITFAIEADWDRNASYESDITGDVEMPGSGVRIDRGMGSDGIYLISKVGIDVSNRAGTYSYGNTASARNGQLRPGVPIRAKVTHATIAYVIWTGYIQRYRASGHQAGAVPICTFECTDLADYLRQYTPVNALVAQRTTSAAYIAIAAACGLAGADYNFPTGAQTLPVHWVRNADALTAFSDVLQSELGGSWFVDADGVIQGQARNTRLGITALAQTWGDGTDIMPRAAVVEVNDADLVSSVSVQANVFIEGDTQVIFYFSRNAANAVPDSMAIAAGDTYAVSLDFNAPVESIVTPVATTDYTANTAIDGTGTDVTASLTVTATLEGAGFALTLKNTTAAIMYITKFELRGLPQDRVSDRPIFTTAKTIVGDKLGRGMQVAIPFADDSTKTRDYSHQLLRIYRYEYPKLTLTFDAGRNDATMVAMLSVELGDLIKYKDTSVTTINTTYSNDWWYVESIRHEIPPSVARATFTTTIVLIPSYLFRDLNKIVHDNFNRANVVGDLGTSAQGAVWARDGNMDIVSNTARANSDVIQMPVLTVGTAAADQVVEASFAAIGAGDEVGLVFRDTDASNQYRAYVTQGTNLLKLEKNVAGVVTQLGASVAYTVGTVAEMRVIIQSTRIRIWIDRYLLLDTTDSALTTGNNAGLFLRTANATATVDDFYGQVL